jgi:hypothetical protein
LIACDSLQCSLDNQTVTQQQPVAGIQIHSMSSVLLTLLLQRSFQSTVSIANRCSWCTTSSVKLVRPVRQARTSTDGLCTACFCTWSSHALWMCSSRRPAQQHHSIHNGHTTQANVWVRFCCNCRTDTRFTTHGTAQQHGSSLSSQQKRHRLASLMAKFDKLASKYYKPCGARVAGTYVVLQT